MGIQIKEYTCSNCKHFKEGYYRYYTYDNRMIEYYRNSCQNHLQSPRQDHKIHCVKWEPKKEL